ncbi:hypothetical protein ACFX10_005447 [Malus domestica]
MSLGILSPYPFSVCLTPAASKLLLLLISLSPSFLPSLLTAYASALAAPSLSSPDFPEIARPFQFQARFSSLDSSFSSGSRVLHLVLLNTSHDHHHLVMN